MKHSTTFASPESSGLASAFTQHHLAGIAHAGAGDAVLLDLIEFFLRDLWKDLYNYTSNYQNILSFTLS